MPRLRADVWVAAYVRRCIGAGAFAALSRRGDASAGAIFIEVESEETESAETAGGYAKEMSEDYKRKQSELVHETLKKQDIAITTALIPGRPAPEIVTADMVAGMKPGSVIIDLAIEDDFF